MRFDSNKAWQEAAQSVAANKDVLWALAGVFFVLPNFAFSIGFPQPEPAAGMTPEQMMGQLGEYYTSAAPFLIVTVILQLLGTLSILTLFTDSRRPTVAEAIRIGARSILPVLGAQVLLGLALGVIAVVLLAAGAVTGSAAITTVAGIMLAMVFFYATIRTMLVSPVVVVDGVRNPVTALQRSWTLIAGNVGRVAVFLLLLGLAVGIVFGLLMLIAGMALAVAVSMAAAKLIAALLSSFVVGAVTIYFVAIVAAIHRQLGGGPVKDIGATFE